MHIAVIDDDCHVHDQVREALHGYKVDIFTNAADFLAQFQNRQHQAIFLSTMLPDMIGTEVAKRIRWLHDASDCAIVYLSKQLDHSTKLFSTQPFDYLLKPLRPQVLRQVVRRIEHRHLPHTMGIRQGNKLLRVAHRDILFIESRAPKLVIHRRYKQLETFGRLSELSLPAPRFLRIHQSFVVNLSHVAMMGVTSVTLFDGQVLDVSRSYRAVVREHLIGLSLTSSNL